jgi:hypothetical protein
MRLDELGMDRRREMKSVARVFGLFLWSLSVSLSAPAEQLCTRASHANGNFWAVVKETRASFSSGPENDGAVPAKLKGFVIRGDLVYISLPDWPQARPPIVCAAYYSPNGDKTYGWLRKSDLLVLEDEKRDERVPQVSTDLRELLLQLSPAASWPFAGVTADPCYHGKDGRFIGDFLCVRRLDLKGKKLCVASTHRPYHAECGELSLGNRYARFEIEGWYVAYLFNNGIAVVAETGMWGNHGQSDPSGVFVFSAWANRACQGRIAPSAEE